LFAKAKKYIKGKIDVVIVYSPPLPLALVGGMVKKRFGAKYNREAKRYDRSYKDNWEINVQLI